MKRKTGMMVAVVAAIGALVAAEAGAAGGRGAGRMNRGGQGSGTCTQTQSSATTQARPAGSQRRDGTFLTTGVTANGSTVRPGYGKGLQDGTGPIAPTTTTPQ